MLWCGEWTNEQHLRRVQIWVTGDGGKFCRKEETRKQMQEAATVAASATRWWKRAGDTMKESETAKKEELQHKHNAEAAKLEAERAEQQAKQLEAIGHFEVIHICSLGALRL